MKIPDEVFTKWKALRSYGDGKKMAEKVGVPEEKISKTWTTQECSDELFVKLAEFFKEKEAMIEKATA